MSTFLAFLNLHALDLAIVWLYLCFILQCVILLRLEKRIQYVGNSVRTMGAVVDANKRIQAILDSASDQLHFLHNLVMSHSSTIAGLKARLLSITTKPAKCSKKPRRK